MLVYGTEYVMWNAIINVHHLSIGHCLPGTVGNPLASTNKGYVAILVNLQFV